MNARFLLLATFFTLLTNIGFAQSTVFLVRHAEKAEASGVDPKDPDLADAGRARADSLSIMLKDARVTRVYATEFKRTQQTAEPIARAAGVQMTIVAARDTKALVEKLKGADGNSLVVGHSNTLPEIIKTLGVAKPLTIQEADYNNLFIWSAATPSQLVHLHYR